MKQTAKNSFVLYTDYKQHISLLTDQEAGKLFKSLFEFVETGETPDFSGSLAMCFSFISAQIQRDKEKYIDICTKRAEAGRIGGKQKQANLANANFDKQKQTNLADNDTDTVTVTDNDTDIDILKNNLCELLNRGKSIAGHKGRLKPGGFYGYKYLIDAGISQSDMLRFAKELSDAGVGVDWLEFEKMIKKRKAEGKI